MARFSVPKAKPCLRVELAVPAIFYHRIFYRRGHRQKICGERGVRRDWELKGELAAPLMSSGLRWFVERRRAGGRHSDRILNTGRRFMIRPEFVWIGLTNLPRTIVS
jgi:hypothetical protein